VLSREILTDKVIMIMPAEKCPSCNFWALPNLAALMIHDNPAMNPSTRNGKRNSTDVPVLSVSMKLLVSSAIPCFETGGNVHLFCLFSSHLEEKSWILYLASYYSINWNWN